LKSLLQKVVFLSKINFVQCLFPNKQTNTQTLNKNKLFGWILNLACLDRTQQSTKTMATAAAAGLCSLVAAQKKLEIRFSDPGELLTEMNRKKL
jgi:hypothetical protein